MTAPAALVLTGPTACGKSAAALALARCWPVEIVSMDSAQVYRGLDLGTAKPTAAERAAVPHHLVDIIDPTETYSAAAFAADARRLIDDIRGRGRQPLVVGGTVLYLRALLGGLHPLPAADATVRAAIEADAAARGWPALHADLARVDAATAARLAPNDAQRIQRALEVWRVSGQPLSTWLAAASPARGPAAVAAVLSLEPASRDWLRQRIDARFRAMLAAGLVDEVRALRARGDLTPTLPSMRCVGYRQTWAALDALAAGDTGAVDALPERGAAATRQLAKRQLTALRGLPDRVVIAADAPDALARLIEWVSRHWGPPAADCA